jgi:DnaJ-domain-containing protein 1
MIATIIYQENEIWVRASYNQEFVDWIKGEVMINCRHWNKENDAWVISYSYEDDLIVECFKLFSAVYKVGKRSVKKTGPRAWKRPKQSPLDSRTAYDVFHLQPSAPPELINAAYRVMAKLYHPDVYNGPDATDQMKKINDAYEKIRKVEKLP